MLGLTTDDLREAKASGRLAVCLDVEGVYALGDQLSLVEFLYQIGVRWMLLVYNRRNLAGSGCHDLDDEGLTQLGRNIPDELIRACAATGGVIGINGVGLFLGEGQPTADAAVRHIRLRRAAGRCGTCGALPPEAIPDVAKGLTQSGYPPAAIRGVLGENLMRVAKIVWK